MPHLSQKTLEKRFACSFCMQTFRTRQGLSGHVQFKHATDATAKDKSFTDWVTDIKIYEQILRQGGLSEKESSELIQVRKDWGYIKALVEDKYTKFNNADFKIFQILAYGQMLSDRRLKAWLTNELGTAITNLMKLSSEITTKKR